MRTGSPAQGSCTIDALGTFATVLTGDPAAAGEAAALLAGDLAAIDVACSRFRPDSELTAANDAGGRPVRVSPLFAEAVAVGLDAARLTAGDVDPACGQSLVRLGYDQDFAVARQEAGPLRLPPLPGGGWRGVRLDSGGRELRLPRGVMLDLGATAKALAADRAARAIAARTGTGVLVNLGGDIAVAGDPPPGGWLVGVADNAGFDAKPADMTLAQTIVIRDGGLATSSVLGRAWRRGDLSLHHIIDPATGLPADTCWRTVTAAARTCVAANIATTAALVRSERATGWLTALGIPARLVRHDGTVVTTCGWPAAIPSGGTA